jgi:hypothetical protein
MPGIEHEEDRCEQRRTRSSVSRMRYSHKFFDPYPSSGVATSDLGRFPFWQMPACTATQSFLRKANHAVFAQGFQVALWQFVKALVYIGYAARSQV